MEDCEVTMIAVETVSDICRDLQNVCARLEKIGHHCIILWTGSQDFYGTSMGVTFLIREPELPEKFLDHCQGNTIISEGVTGKEEAIKPTQSAEATNTTQDNSKETVHVDDDPGVENDFDDMDNDDGDDADDGDDITMSDDIDDEDYTPGKDKTPEKLSTRSTSRSSRTQSSGKTNLNVDGPGMRTRHFAKRRPVLNLKDRSFTKEKPQLKKTIIKLKRLKQSGANITPAAGNVTKTTGKKQQTIEKSVTKTTDKSEEDKDKSLSSSDLSAVRVKSKDKSLSSSDISAFRVKSKDKSLSSPDLSVVAAKPVVMYNNMEVVDPEEALTSDTPVCFKCYKICSSITKLKVHMTTQHSIKLGYLCACGKFLSTKQEFNQHKTSVSHLDCRFCSKVYTSKPKLNFHIEDAHSMSMEDIKNEFECEKCGSTFLYKQFLEMHQRKLPQCAEIVAQMNSNELSKITYTNEQGETVTQSLDEIMSSKTEPKHKCVVCQKGNRNNADLKKHVSSHIPDRQFLCTICGLKVKCANSLKTHKKCHILKPHHCTDCRARYQTETELRIHIEEECRGENHENLQCDLCNFKGLSRYELISKAWCKIKSALEAHKNVHTGHRPFLCVRCGKAMATKGSLLRHIQAMHGEARDFKCNLCEREFKTKDTLSRHIKRHSNPAYKCEICGKTCTERGNLNKHMQTHTKEKSFVCEICGSKYARKAMLQIHLRTHTGELPYECEEKDCGKRFRSQTLLKQHSVSHSKSYGYVCDICGRGFKHSGRLNYHKKSHSLEHQFECVYCPSKHKTLFIYKSHLAKHHPEKKNDLEERFKIRLYECYLCHKVYSVKEDLSRHIYIHMGYKPFKCSFCGKSFNDKSNFKAHEKSHTSKKMYVCPICQKAFKHHKTLVLHHKTFHASQPFLVNKASRPIQYVHKSERKDENLEEDENILQVEIIQDPSYQYGNIVEVGKRNDPWQDRGACDINSMEPIQPRVTVDPSHSLLEPLMIVENF